MATNDQAVESLLPGVPLVESPFFEELVSIQGFDDEELRIAKELRDRGFAIIDFPDSEFSSKADRIKKSLAPRFDLIKWRKEGAQESLRIQDAWQTNRDVLNLAINANILQLLGRLYGRRAWPFQTLNFPVGTQQHFHTDSIHFSSHPERFMCGVWVALEDVSEDAGPLVYYPGSHRWPIYTNEHAGVPFGATITQATYEPLWRALVRKHGLDPQHFLPQKGQALIWAANLLHGGARQNNPALTRWSQVTHYFFDDCSYYTPALSHPFFGRIDFREMRDVRTGDIVPHSYIGRPVPNDFLERVSAPPPSLPDGFDAALYLKANPDVAATGIDPAHHYLMHGRHEDRPLVPTIIPENESALQENRLRRVFRRYPR